jgi:hypothetical protein
MATVVHEKHRLRTFGDDAIVITWTPLTVTNNYGDPIQMPGSADRSIQITGALGTLGAVTMYGSNVVDPDLSDDDDWFILDDAKGNPIVLDSLRGEEIVILPLWIRPKITAGDGSTALAARLVMKGNLI